MRLSAYGVQDGNILGVRYGVRGFLQKDCKPVVLTPRNTDGIHLNGEGLGAGGAGRGVCVVWVWVWVGGGVGDTAGCSWHRGWAQGGRGEWVRVDNSLVLQSTPVVVNSGLHCPPYQHTQSPCVAAPRGSHLFLNQPLCCHAPPLAPSPLTTRVCPPHRWLPPGHQRAGAQHAGWGE
jgi:hypothetical protein